MTDARLPGPWLTRLEWMRLSDRAIRTLTQSLMWSNEAGTDGDLPPDVHHLLHPAGVDDATAEELIRAGWWERTAAGYRVPDWTGTAGQESAERVAARRANNRRRQQKHRDVTRDVTELVVGEDTTGTGEDSLTEHQLAGTSRAREMAMRFDCTDCQRNYAFDKPPCPQHLEVA